MTIVVGLTGGIASGKSTASNYFRQQGIPVIDSDVIAREVVEPGTTGLALIVAEFGNEILNGDGSLNRKQLGSLVFAEPSLRVKLDRLLAAELNVAISNAIQTWLAQEVPLLIVDIPLLFEAGYDQTVDLTMVVYVGELIQQERLMIRDGLSATEASQRISSQWPLSEKKKLADVVINNEGSRAETEAQLSRWLKKILN